MRTFSLSGRILHKHANNQNSPIPNLIVEAWNRNGHPVTPENIDTVRKDAKRLAGAITDEHGRYHIEIDPKVFSSASETELRPDLLIVVLAPDEPGLDISKRLLHLSHYAPLNEGTADAEIFMFSTELLTEKGIPLGLPSVETRRVEVEDQVKRYVDASERRREFDKGAADYHSKQVKVESERRQAFRVELIKKIGFDLTAVKLGGVVVKEGDDIQQKNSETILRGIAKANETLSGQARGVPVSLYLNPADQDRLKSFFDNANGQPTVEIPETEIHDILFRSNSTENPGTLLIKNNPITSFCAAETMDIACAKAHSGISHPHETPPDTDGTSESDKPITNEDILTHINRLMKDMPSADIVMKRDIAKHANTNDIESKVKAFSLGRGPGEGPSFYDFDFLEIAFEHVWQQLFDETIPNLAYTAETMAQSKLGINSFVSDVIKNGTIVADTFRATGPPEVSPVIAKYFDITVEEMVEMSFSMRQQLFALADTIDKHPADKVSDLRRIQSLVDQGERLIDSVRNNEYYTLHRTLRDLQERLSRKYEFTVFAANKDYHSINFGLIKTYSQWWTPLGCKPGKLLKTIPLAPNEERKYTVKHTRNEKRSSKEARKTDVSITSEQHSASRVEAEVMFKAQNKKNFGFNFEGAYSGSGYQVKAGSSYGVDAINESARNRKELRELTSKEIQKYEFENQTEVTSQIDELSEITESGSIQNTNQEVTVTYFFYQLQKCFRLSEQLSRVMPVVLVAQEVPSPDQITPAWVIAHDWILDRCLLDESFRPTLRYLANNSVGDDFSIRELRKNLRQQRNLVETLKIEFATASQEAQNKYAALLTRINKSLSEQESAAGEGFFTNVVAFFGSNDADPDSARARELAASDEHKYAVEKADKLAAALREEVNTLHTLTANFNKTLKERLDNETKVKRLLAHIVEYLFYYLQAIWGMEDPDRRILRLHKVRVPILELAERNYTVSVAVEDDIFQPFREPGTEKHKAFLHGTLKHNANGDFDTKTLVEVCELDKLIGCFGNYLIFPLKEHNALTEFMSAPYIDNAFGAMDPDELSNVNLDDYSKYICCLHDTLPENEFEALKPFLKAWLNKLLATPLRNGDEVVIPTDSMYIEAMVDKNPLLEDFRLKHRELDVSKEREALLRSRLESLRLASRLLHNEREDPDIEKKIVVETPVTPNIDVDNP